jgi:hypothetical protein
MLFNHACTFFFTTEQHKTTSYEIIPSGHAAAQRDCPKQNVPRKATTEKITRWQKPLFCASNLSRVGTKMYFIVSPKFLYDNKRQNLKLKIEIHCEFSLVNVFNFTAMFEGFCKNT